MRKIGADNFYKPPGSALTLSSGQSANVVKTNKFERYQSPAMKLNQGGITAK